MNLSRTVIRQSSGLAPWLTLNALWYSLVSVVFVRRATGALTVPLGFWEIIGTSIVVVAVSAMLRSGATQLLPATFLRYHRWLLVAPLVAGIALLASVTLDGTSTFGAVAGWSLFVATEACWMQRDWKFQRANHSVANEIAQSSETTTSTRRPSGVPVSDQRGNRPTRPMQSEVVTNVDAERPVQDADSEDLSEKDYSDDEESLPDDVDQQWTRTRAAGEDSLSGMYRVRFTVGERTQTVHLPFYPPFESVPKVQILQVAGAELAWQVSQIESFGLRMEVRRKASEVGQDAGILHLHVSRDRSPA